MSIAPLQSGFYAQAIAPDTPVLSNRPIARRTYPLPVFSHDRWRLDAAIFEPHTESVTFDWTRWPATLRRSAKTYVWVLLNHQPTDEQTLDGLTPLSVRTISTIGSTLRPFAHFLADKGHGAFSEATQDDLDDYLDYLLRSPMSDDRRRDLAYEVVRLWAYRLLLPEDLRLPAAPPWNGAEPRDLFGTRQTSNENKTPRIDERTMQALLTWSLRFINDFAPDILAAASTYNHLSPRGPRKYSGRAARTPQPGRVIAGANEYLTTLREQGLPLPGRTSQDGNLEPHYPLIARHLDCAANNVTTAGVRPIIDGSGLPISPKGYVVPRCTGTIDGSPWLEHGIGYDEAPRLAVHLRTAALIVIAYLSGMRPGEALSLQRGCVNHDRSTGLWTINGTVWKGATDSHGVKLHMGEARALPWVVVPEVAEAVDVMERLHTHGYLFPTKVTKYGASPGESTALRPSQAAMYVNEFVAWVNRYCATNDRPDTIPEDRANPNLSLSRLRRTLAWHICRRPRGLAAASLQYGHVLSAVTLGYAGNAASGFPDEYAFERFLSRLDDIRDDHHLLTQGEHVSGPAADVYRQRVLAANTEFEGVAFVSDKQARAYLSNNALRLYEGRGLTCVHDPDKAVCQQKPPMVEPTITPDLSDCKPDRCQNVARTDRDIDVIRQRATLLRDITADPLAPPLRVAREAAELERLNAIIDNHETSRPHA